MCNRFFLASILTLFTSYSNGQNPSFSIIFDSIYPLIQSGDYTQAKEHWIKAEKEYPIDQQEKYLFLLNSLRNDDVSFFKKEMLRLIKESGYNLSALDTAYKYGDQACDLYREKGVLNWVVEKSEKYYPKWMQKNPIAYRVHETSEYFLSRDQNFIKLAIPVCDSSDSCMDKRNQHYEKIAIMEASELATFIIDLGTVPNNIDHGVDVYYPLLIVLHHICECSEKSMNYAWNLLKPHFEKAYLQGKIDNSVFYIYDEASYLHTGYQYYGMYGDAPVKDEDEYREVKERLKL